MEKKANIHSFNVQTSKNTEVMVKNESKTSENIQKANLLPAMNKQDSCEQCTDSKILIVI